MMLFVLDMESKITPRDPKIVAMERIVGTYLFDPEMTAKKVETFPENCFVIPSSEFLMLTG